MELILRAAIVYVALLVTMRLSGNRQFSQITAFDLILLLIIAEAVSEALHGDDHSVVGGLIIATTLIFLDIVISLAKRRWERVDRLVEGVPVLLMENGNILKENLRRERVDVSDILDSARQSQGIESLDQVKYAVLERDGNISIIPSG